MKAFLPKLSIILVLFSGLLFSPGGFAQYSPVTVTGFNQDVIAESGTSSLATTSSALDGVTVSNKVMYTAAFRTANGFGGGGIVDNGTITSGADVYQLGSYAADNALIVQRGQNSDLTIATPASYSSIRVLAFSTEGSSLVNASLFFTDGSSTSVLTNYSLPDWFNGATNVVTQGFGRVTRATPASGSDAYPTNPRLYYININLSCTDRQKLLQRINFSNVTTAGTNAPFPNAVFFAVSGRSFTQTITPNITNATCSTNGSVTLNVSGNQLPYNITWNSTPAQSGPTASNLPAGIYTATITDVNSCVTSYNATVALTNNVTLNSISNQSICYGGSFTPNINSNAASYSWSPATGVSNPAIANPVFSPLNTTTYTLTATLGSCTKSTAFTINVSPQINLVAHQDTTICNGASFNANTVGNAGSYSWSPSTGVSNPGLANPVLAPTTTTTYTITGTTGSCSVSKRFTVTVVAGVLVDAGNPATIIEGNSITLLGSGSPGSYAWTPASTLSAANVLYPVAKPLVTTTYTLSVTSAQGCRGTDDVTITVVPYCVKPMEAITPNGDGLNDQWIVTNGNCASAVKVKVFNRYGSLVYEAADYKNDWTGTYKGKPVPDGAYYFVIEYHLIDGRDVPIKGNLTIIR